MNRKVPGAMAEKIALLISPEASRTVERAPACATKACVKRPRKVKPRYLYWRWKS